MAPVSGVGCSSPTQHIPAQVQAEAQPSGAAHGSASELVPTATSTAPQRPAATENPTQKFAELLDSIRKNDFANVRLLLKAHEQHARRSGEPPNQASHSVMQRLQALVGALEQFEAMWRTHPGAIDKVQLEKLQQLGSQFHMYSMQMKAIKKKLKVDQARQQQQQQEHQQEQQLQQQAAAAAATAANGKAADAVQQQQVAATQQEQQQQAAAVAAVAAQQQAAAADHHLLLQQYQQLLQQHQQLLQQHQQQHQQHQQQHQQLLQQHQQLLQQHQRLLQQHQQQVQQRGSGAAAGAGVGSPTLPALSPQLEPGI